MQSAMMKRTDSVKRWSVSSQPSLQRADPVVSSRASLESANRTAAPQPGGSRPNSRGKESSSRPTSSNGNEATPLTVDISQAQSSEQRGHEENEKTSPPTSPSKTMDPRRWSPTKSSSWLEAALNKPESPKPKPAPPQSSQPAWMVELNKAKAQKAGTPSSDLERSSSVARKHEVKTGGLMRSSPMGGGIKPPGLGGVGAHHSPSTSISGDKGASSSFRSNLSRSTSNDDPDASSGKPPPTAAGSPPTTRTKPETPPKKDFRNNLKARQLPPGDAKSDGNEFKNVFGALRPTKTQNFVAQDVFKDNIMRGKAALNLTGGPKPREKKDELKEAILQKKAEFKQAKQEGRGVATNAHGPVEKPLPEGLAKKMEMARQGGALSRRASAASETTSDTPSGTFASNRTSAVSTFSKRDSADTIATPLEKDAPWPALNKDKSPPPGRFPKPGGGALADRFNPALAGFLARGPPSMAAGPGKDSSDKPGSEEPSAPGPQLSHMTKNRARGPKRKAPSSAVTASDSSRIGTIALVDSSRKTAPEAVLSPGAMISLVDSSKRSPADGPVIPLVDSSRMDMRPRSPTKIHEQVAAVAARAQQPSARAVDERPEESTSQPPSPRKLDMTKLSRFLDESALADEMPRPLSPSKTGGRPLPEPRPLSPQKTGGRPLPASPRKDVFSDSVDPGPVMSARNGAALFGGAAATAAAAAAAAKPTRVSATPVLQPQRGRSRSPTKSSGPVPPIEIGFGPTSPPLSSPMRSPTRYAVEVSAMFKDFFGNERPHREYHADTADILMKRPVPEPKINTQKVQLFRLSGDGKKQAVPAHHERVLFEREMYLCPHVFTNESGKKVSEVYFWAGDEVPEATIEDAQIFANREARAQGGKLVRLQQGKETGEFIQALGGILIIRRGSSNKYDSLAANMLCGRQYLGQITFDEVDFAPNSLCSGFPYLITQQGKCYLWKGKGSDVDELSCARLIGMDLALMGELAEVDDGDEPAEFWDIFDGGGSKAGSADHWRLKPNYGKYCARLFCSDAASRQQVGENTKPIKYSVSADVESPQIVEIHPFCQADLSPSNIYILDAFFEMYIVVGYGAQSQYAAFHNALDFAQEYAILASGMEDRPYVPISTVVLEGIPRDLKSVFRKWRDGASPTRMNANNPVSPSLKRGRSLRIVPLNQALQALAE